jgi:DNA-binding NarL/FixJ family response regulator
MAAEIATAIIHDDRRIREGLVVLLNGTPGFRAVAAWRTMEEALAGLPQAKPHVVLLEVDTDLPGMSGIEAIRHVSEVIPGVPVVVLGRDDENVVFDAICSGAGGYLRSDTPPGRVLDAVREAARGGAPLSPDIAARVIAICRRLCPPRAGCSLSHRERDVLRSFLDGKSYKASADSMNVSVDTLRYHVRRLYRKLGVNSKSEAVLRAHREGLVR